MPARFTVKPGPLYHFDGVRITGTDRLKPEYLRNRFRKLHGKVYDPKVLDELYQEMIKTGLFAQLKVDPVPCSPRTQRCGWTSASRRRRRASSASRWVTGRSKGVHLRRGTARPRPDGHGPADLVHGGLFHAHDLSGELLYVDPTWPRATTRCACAWTRCQRDLDTLTRKTSRSGAWCNSRARSRKKLTFSVFAQVDSVKTTEEHVQDFNLGKKTTTPTSWAGPLSLDLRDNPVAPTKGLITAVTGGRILQRARRQHRLRARHLSA